MRTNMRQARGRLAPCERRSAQAQCAGCVASTRRRRRPPSYWRTCAPCGHAHATGSCGASLPRWSLPSRRPMRCPAKCWRRSRSISTSQSAYTRDQSRGLDMLAQAAVIKDGDRHRGPAVSGAGKPAARRREPGEDRDPGAPGSRETAGPHPLLRWPNGRAATRPQPYRARRPLKKRADPPSRSSSVAPSNVAYKVGLLARPVLMFTRVLRTGCGPRQTGGNAKPEVSLFALRDG